MKLKSLIPIEKPSISNVPEIARIHFNCWKQNYAGIINQIFLDNLNFETFIKKRHQIIQNNSIIQFISSNGSRITGFYEAGHRYISKKQIISNESKKNRNELGEIYSIYVDPEFQRNGIGNALFQHARNRLKEKTLTPFIVWSFQANTISCKFYEKLGGKQVDTTIGTWGGEKYLLLGYQFEQ